MIKRIITYSILLFPAIIFYTACDDEVYPKGELVEKYVLNCILSGDTSYQVAFLTRTYDVEGFDPYINDVNPAVRNADIRLIHDGITYQFRDTVIAANENSRYPDGIYYYYLDNFTPGQRENVVIEARTEDRTLLQSEIRTFYKRLLPGSFYRSDFLVPPDEIRPTLFFQWANFDETVYFIPQLSIVYSRNINGEEVKCSKVVPQIFQNGTVVYPDLLVGDQIEYEMDAFDYMFDSIAEDGVPREDYKIHYAEFKVLIVDESLAKYYSAARTFADSYTIQVTEPEYSNIVGGLGLFGSFDSQSIYLNIKRDYIEAFGYSTVD